jgi:Spy/CpxP family protein refolding chaperone
MKAISAVLAVAFALSSNVAVAGDEKMEHGDMDHDKMMEACMMHGADMTPEERKKMMDKVFAEIDIDKNGSVSRSEFDKHHETMRSKHEENEEREDKKEGHDHATEHKGHG